MTVIGFRAVAGGYIPAQDKQYLFAILKLPEAATIDRTDAVMRRMGKIALDTPGVADVVQFPGLNAVHFVSTPNAGVMFIGLEPQDKRDIEAARHRHPDQHAVRPDPGRLRLSRSCRRRCWDSATPMASSCTCRTAAASATASCTGTRRP